MTKNLIEPIGSKHLWNRNSCLRKFKGDHIENDVKLVFCIEVVFILFLSED